MNKKHLPVNKCWRVASAVVVAVGLVSCGKQASTEDGAKNAPSKSEVMTVAGTSFTVSPNPVQGNAQHLAVVKLAFTTDKTNVVEIHVGSPSGTMMCRSAAPGVCDTGLWVNDGMMFYLQDGTAAKVNDPAATLGYVTAHVN